MGEEGERVRGRASVVQLSDGGHEGFKEEGILCEPFNQSPTTSNAAKSVLQSQSNVSFTKSPVVKLHRVQNTPPSAQSADQLRASSSTAAHTAVEQKKTSSGERSRLELDVKDDYDGQSGGTGTQDRGGSGQAGAGRGGECASAAPKLRRSPRKKLELTLNEAAPTTDNEQPLSLSESGTQLRRSPARISGYRARSHRLVAHLTRERAVKRLGTVCSTRLLLKLCT